MPPRKKPAKAKVSRLAAKKPAKASHKAAPSNALVFKGTPRDDGKYRVDMPLPLPPCGAALVLVPPCGCRYKVDYPSSMPKTIIFKGKGKCSACTYTEIVVAGSEPPSPAPAPLAAPASSAASGLPDWYGADGDVRFAEVLYVLDERPACIPDSVYVSDEFAHRFRDAGSMQNLRDTVAPFLKKRAADTAGAGAAIRDHIQKLRKKQAQLMFFLPNHARSRDQGGPSNGKRWA
jgi:hypothetical protein